MLFDAHTRRFAALGGIARRGIYDNMKTAVDKVKKGKGRVPPGSVLNRHYHAKWVKFRSAPTKGYLPPAWRLKTAAAPAGSARLDAPKRFIENTEITSPAHCMYTVAVDIGGTFTDVVVIDDASGNTYAGKCLTTPDDLQRGVFDGLDDAAAQVGVDVRRLLSRTSRMVHATTQSSNAVFSYTGARCAVLATRGFGDTLLIMRATGRVAGLTVFERHHYRMTQKPRLLVDERDIFEIPERVDYKGHVVQPLDEPAVRTIAAKLRDRGYQAVAVALLFSHKNAVHEQRVREILTHELPDVYLSLSSEVAPVMGEYERSATALFNAYVGPVIENYVSRLEGALAAAGLQQTLLMMQANGGVTSAAHTVPIFTVESGPAAGVVGAAQIATSMDLPNVIATDVGGTTFKVAIVEDGHWGYSRETVLNQYQLRLPMIDVASIGAGGGSIAWVDGRRLRIGPQSAGASPGPACYDLGGEEPTVTDADLVLGYLSPDRFLGGRMKLHVERAHQAIQHRIADPLFGGDTLAAAAGIRTVIDSHMADLIRKTTLERGYDPRAFVVFAYGGAGPVHASSYAAEVGVSKIIVPFFATVHSAYGAALSDVRFSLQHSHPLVPPVAPEIVESIYGKMEADGTRRLDEADVPRANQRHERWVEARYRRQVHHLRVPAPGRVDEAGLARMLAAFESEYERLFGKGAALRDAGIELVNYGVDAVGAVPSVAIAPWKSGGVTAPQHERMTWCPRRRDMMNTPVYDGPSLPAQARIEGPAIIEHPGTTIVVLTGQTATIDDQRHTHIDLGASRA